MEPLTIDQLLADCREELDDQSEPYLWSDTRLVSLINEAVSQANIRAHLFVDETTAEICSIAIVAGTAEYDLSRSIITIEQARLLSTTGETLTRASESYLDYFRGANWRQDSGRPEFIVRTTRNRLLLSPTPDATDTLKLKVWRHLTDDETLAKGDDLLDIGLEAQHHAKLLHWVCHRALMKRDVETQSMRDSETHLAMFEQHFGPMPSARQLEMRSMDARTPVREVWF